MTVRFPTASRIFELAAKHGLAVHIEYGADGKVSSLDFVGKVARDTVAEPDDLDRELAEFQVRNGQA
jgi:hypothetical protein